MLDDIYATSTPPPNWHLANEFRIHVIGPYPLFNLFMLIANLSLSLSALYATLMSPLMTVPELWWKKLFSINDLWKGTKVTHTWLIRIDHHPLRVWFMRLKHEFNWVWIIQLALYHSVIGFIIYFLTKRSENVDPSKKRQICDVMQKCKQKICEWMRWYVKLMTQETFSNALTCCIIMLLTWTKEYVSLKTVQKTNWWLWSILIRVVECTAWI